MTFPSKSQQPGMLRIFQQGPIEASIVVPLTPLPKFASHEQQLLAGMALHIAVQQPQVCELTPVIAGHLRNQGILAVDCLIVR